MIGTVDVLHSGIWQLSSIVLADAGECLVIDPGYFPRELVEVAALARSRGKVRGTVFTHGHWDHVVGWQAFPEAPVYGAADLVKAVQERTPLARRNLDQARDFDGRWYVRRSGLLEWPAQLSSLSEGARLRIGQLELQIRETPGHSHDGLAILVPARRLLITGDYLSPCEIPFVEDVVAYQRTLHRLAALLEQVDEVIPGHGPRSSSAAALTVLKADLVYLEQLAEHASRGESEAALKMAWPRAEDVPGMREHHLENCVAVGLKVGE